MWKTKLCLGLNSQFRLPYDEQIKLFHSVGFDGFFSSWDGTQDEHAYRRLADELHMEYQSVHAPFTNAAKLWTGGPQADCAVGELICCLHSCADAGVPIMIVHAFIGFEEHSPNGYGALNFGKVVAEAEKLGVKIAFENTEGEEYLAELMRALGGSEAVGFCWDTGHELCYNRGKDMPALYGSKLICTHLNDNLGIRDFGGKITYIDDLHLLPFDGIADWSDIVSRLNREGYSSTLTFELNTKSKPDRRENDIYDRMDIRDYVTEAYKRACRVAALRDRLNQASR